MPHYFFLLFFFKKTSNNYTILFIVFKPTRGNLYRRITVWPKENFVSFQFKLMSLIGVWRNVFHFTLLHDSSSYGDRCPALFLINDQIEFVTALNGYRNGALCRGLSVPTNVFIPVYYEQRFNATTGNYVIKTFINNTLVNEVVNNDARDFQDVKLYIGNPWYESPDVIIKDFKYGIF